MANPFDKSLYLNSPEVRDFTAFPSLGKLKFSEFSGSSYHWAQSNIMANWVLTAA
jgi:hypothetical protein